MSQTPETGDADEQEVGYGAGTGYDDEDGGYVAGDGDTLWDSAEDLLLAPSEPPTTDMRQRMLEELCAASGFKHAIPHGYIFVRNLDAALEVAERSPTFRAWLRRVPPHLFPPPLDRGKP